MIRFICAAILSLAMISPMIAQSSEIATKVDAYLKPYMDMNCFSGAILISKGDQILLSKGYGMANYELDVPNTPRTKFRLASVTKTFTTMAIVQLVERKMLSLEDKLSKFIPDYPSGDKITITMLINHSAGIPAIPNDDELEKNVYSSTEEVIKLFKHLPLDFEPGKDSRYSNTGFVLLSYIIEKVSGKSYEEFLAENIFKPAGMNDTGDDRHEKLLKNRASGYMPAVDGDGLVNAPFTDNYIKVGAGSLYSTAEDLYRWERAMASKKLMKTPMASVFPSRTWFGRRVATQDGTMQGFNAAVAKFRDDDLWIVVLTNNSAWVRNAIIKDLAAIALGEKYEIPSVKQPARVAPAAIDAVIGSYRFENSGSGFTIFRNAKGTLVMKIAGRDARIIPQSETEFFVPLWWARCAVAKGDKGEVTHLMWYDHGSPDGMRVPRVKEDSK
jgi:CubicO group peptidase (beta-lactamase class C family)